MIRLIAQAVLWVSGIIAAFLFPSPPLSQMIVGLLLLVFASAVTWAYNA